MSRFRRLFTFSNIVAMLALMIAISGTSYALVISSKQIKNESLTSIDIKDGSVKVADLSTASVGSKEVIDNSLKLRDINNEVERKHEENLLLQRPTTSQPIPAAPGAVNVAEMPLAAGKYLAIASIQIEGGLSDESSNFSHYTVTCRMWDPAGVEAVRSVDLHGEYHDDQVLTLLLGHSNSGEGLVVDCNRSSSVAMSNVPLTGAVELAVVPVDNLSVPLGSGGG